MLHALHTAHENAMEHVHAKHLNYDPKNWLIVGISF